MKNNNMFGSVLCEIILKSTFRIQDKSYILVGGFVSYYVVALSYVLIKFTMLTKNICSRQITFNVIIS